MFEVLSHQTHTTHKLENLKNSFCVYLVFINTENVPRRQRHHSHTQTKTRDAPTSVLGRIQQI